MRVLVVGGAGYIGSHMVKILCRGGIEVTTLDNLGTGHRDAVVGGRFVQGDLADRATLERVFAHGRFDGVMHFASFIQVEESVRDPGKYYRNNVVNTLNLLDIMVAHGVRCLIFSSSAAIFGEPKRVPIDETHPKDPINPYGRSKWMVEQMLADYDSAHGLKSVCLRYFNAAGADPEGELGEHHAPETHLIPLVLQAAAGRLPQVTVFGTDYDTPDGTCIRDYIHVNDLCDAHWLALHQLEAGGGEPRLQPWQWQRLLGAGSHRNRARRDRPRGSGGIRRAPAGRSRAAGGGRQPRLAGPRLAPAPRRPRRHRRARLALGKRSAEVVNPLTAGTQPAARCSRMATAGSFLPSRNSRNAPPPVEI